jgi:hypothetical protein
MDKIKAVFSYLAAPLEWTAGLVAKYPKGALMVWAASLVVVAWVF